MDSNETETALELAQRHVVEAAAWVAALEARLAQLTQDGHDTAAAELLLSTMKERLLLMRAHLAAEQELAAGRSPT